MLPTDSNTPAPLPVNDESARLDLAACVTQSLEQYFQDLDGEIPTGVHAMVIRRVERPVLEFVMKQCDGKQIAAAEMLGINRNTLRKKLTEHGLI